MASSPVSCGGYAKDTAPHCPGWELSCRVRSLSSSLKNACHPAPGTPSLAEPGRDPIDKGSPVTVARSKTALMRRIARVLREALEHLLSFTPSHLVNMQSFRIWIPLRVRKQWDSIRLLTRCIWCRRNLPVIRQPRRAQHCRVVPQDPIPMPGKPAPGRDRARPVETP